MIYLDNFGHLFSDKDVDELYDFAVVKLGLKAEWNHYSRHFPHFDLTTKRKVALALSLGAKKVDTREFLELVKKMKDIYPTTLLPWVKGKGLAGQDILRVDFKTYFTPH